MSATTRRDGPEALEQVFIFRTIARRWRRDRLRESHRLRTRAPVTCGARVVLCASGDRPKGEPPIPMGMPCGTPTKRLV